MASNTAATQQHERVKSEAFTKTGAGRRNFTKLDTATLVSLAHLPAANLGQSVIKLTEHLLDLGLASHIDLDICLTSPRQAIDGTAILLFEKLRAIYTNSSAAPFVQQGNDRNQNHGQAENEFHPQGTQDAQGAQEPPEDRRRDFPQAQDSQPTFDVHPMNFAPGRSEATSTSTAHNFSQGEETKQDVQATPGPADPPVPESQRRWDVPSPHGGEDRECLHATMCRPF